MKLQAFRPRIVDAQVVLVPELSQVFNIVSTGLDALETMFEHLHKRGGTLVLAEPTKQPLSLLERSDMLERIGPHNVFEGLDDALAALRDRHRMPGDDRALRPPAAPEDPR
jgi:SulP family sulfate permease